jgi:hypothetical protein
MGNELTRYRISHLNNGGVSPFRLSACAQEIKAHCITQIAQWVLSQEHCNNEPVPYIQSRTLHARVHSNSGIMTV